MSLENHLSGLNEQILDKTFGPILQEIVSEFPIIGGNTYATRLLKLAEKFENE